MRRDPSASHGFVFASQEGRARIQRARAASDTTNNHKQERGAMVNVTSLNPAMPVRRVLLYRPTTDMASFCLLVP